MTFRPSDDVLDGMENWQQPLDASAQYNQISNESVPDGSTWPRIFSNPNDEDNVWNSVETVDVTPVQPAEEVKAPDLSELLENSESAASWTEVASDDKVSDESNEDFTVDLSEIENNKWWESSKSGESVDNGQDKSDSKSDWWSKSNQEEEFVDLGKMPDSEREEIISWIEWSIHSKLDLLVDGERKSVVEMYKKIYRIIFRWGIFILTVILGILWCRKNTNETKTISRKSSWKGRWDFWK